MSRRPINRCRSPYQPIFSRWMVNRQFCLPDRVVWLTDASAGHGVSKPDDGARFGRVSGIAAVKVKAHEIIEIKSRVVRRNTDWVLVRYEARSKNRKHSVDSKIALA